MTIEISRLEGVTVDRENLAHRESTENGLAIFSVILNFTVLSWKFFKSLAPICVYCSESSRIPDRQFAHGGVRVGVGGRKIHMLQKQYLFPISPFLFQDTSIFITLVNQCQNWIPWPWKPKKRYPAHISIFFPFFIIRSTPLPHNFHGSWKTMSKPNSRTSETLKAMLIYHLYIFPPLSLLKLQFLWQLEINIKLNSTTLKHKKTNTCLEPLNFFLFSNFCSHPSTIFIKVEKYV